MLQYYNRHLYTYMQPNSDHLPFLDHTCSALQSPLLYFGLSPAGSGRSGSAATAGRSGPDATGRRGSGSTGARRGAATAGRRGPVATGARRGAATSGRSRCAASGGTVA